MIELEYFFEWSNKILFVSSTFASRFIVFHRRIHFQIYENILIRVLPNSLESEQKK